MIQPTLFNLPPKLTERQQDALDALARAGDAGLNGQECGEQVHALRGCKWCRQGDCHWAAKEGRELLEKLVDVELAARRRHGRYTVPGVALAGEDARTARPSLQTNEIPF